MRPVSISSAAAERWNSFVAQWPNFSLMQSYEWGTFKERMGWKAIRLAVEQNGQLIAGAQMFVKSLPLGLASIAYVPRGPLLDWEDQAATQTLLSAISAAARQHRAISLKIEPATPYSPELQKQLQAYGFRPNHFNNHPRCSMLIDLSSGPETILARMRKTTRYNIRYSARKGVTVREATDEDLDVFYRLLEHVAERTGVPPRLQSHYRQEWATLAPLGRLKIFLATYKGDVLAMRAPAIFGKVAATLYSGSFNTYEKLKSNELLMWESMQWAKSQGCTVYDVWGIPDEIGENITHGTPLPEEKAGGLWGVYDFKRGFGGKVIYYIGTHDYIYSRPLYWLMDTLISRLGSLDKLARLTDRLGL